MVKVFIQARMSSERFPGKVLAPFCGKPVIAHILDKMHEVVSSDHIIVLTSIHQSDDPLAAYVNSLGISVFRGSLENVFERFRECLHAFPCLWFFRICADSPLHDPSIFHTMISYADRTDIDLVTNIFPRTYPPGRSVEMINTARFGRIDADSLTSEEQEHVTKVYYKHPHDFSIVNIKSPNPKACGTSLTIDTIEDLRRLEKLLKVSSRNGHNPVEDC